MLSEGSRAAAEEESKLRMDTREELEALFEKHGYTDFKWIEPEDIIVSQWVRMKCTFGCGEYGQNASCPPNVPSVSECRRFFSDYGTAVIFHFEKTVDKPEDRHAWSKEVNQALLELEREVFLSGYQRAFLLFMDSCSMCSKCPGIRVECKKPRLARPAPEAMAVDVFATVRQYGYPIEVLKDYAEAMNRYAFLMIE
jgi:predicted metal-binding protein